ncbi:MAG: hypothetical protein HY271_09645 [Deltaproteobacteria bacterium]|nr:hypothetical protein [Deltaproteobacteria bacterium]
MVHFSDFSVARDLLRNRGAASIEHIEGDLLSHLEGTAALLASWGADLTLQLAGLCHAAYGTDGLSASLLTLGERRILIRAIGADAERLVYLYAACIRDDLYPRFGRDARLDLRDRFTGATRLLPQDEVRNFVELTFANELELARRLPAFAATYRTGLVELFRRCRAYASRAAYRCFLDTFSARAARL